MYRSRFLPGFCLATVLFLAGTRISAQAPELRHISGGVYCLMDESSNACILVTDKGVLMADAKSGPLALKEKKIVDTLIKNRPVKYLINTHYHADQTGGDAVFGKDATLVMHASCKAALARQLEATGGDAGILANVVTWKEGMKFTLGDETVRVLHLGNAHTSGDLVLAFEKAKVLFMGDLFCCGVPPDPDVGDHSDTENWISALNTLFGPYFEYIVVPGQGPVSNVVNLKKYSNCLSYIRNQVGSAIAAGKTREETIASVDVQRFAALKDPRPGGDRTIQKTIGAVYDEMTRKKK